MIEGLDANQNLRWESCGMNAAGIDVSKGKSMVAVFRPFNEMVAKPFKVRHTGSELQQLADYLKNLDGGTRVVMEHTGRYYEQIAQYLHDEGIYVSAVNPKIIKDYGTGNTLRHIQTDKADAKKIAKFGIDRWTELRQYDSLSTENAEPTVRSVYQNQDDDEEQSHRPSGPDLPRCELPV